MQEFNLNTTMKEVETQFPFSRSLLHAKFHVGGCATCGYEPNESIEDVAKKHSKDPDAMLQELNKGLQDMENCEISPQEFHQAFVQHRLPKSLVLDVREKWEFDFARIEGSLLLTEENMEEAFQLAREAEHLAIVCHHGIRSMNATLFLRQNGLLRARSLQGGLEKYATTVNTSFPRY